MSDILKTVLLLALPASGKSEVRKFLREDISSEELARDFHLGPTAQIDDFPYVNLMRRIDEERVKIGLEPVFFSAPDQPFRDPCDWGTLIHLVNFDYEDLAVYKTIAPKSAAVHLLARLQRARAAVGLNDPTKDMTQENMSRLIAGIEPDANEIVRARNAVNWEGLESKTVVIEFARGGPRGATMPLPAPLGYEYSLSQLSPEILAEAVILYVQVEPWQSWTKNFERAKPGKEGDDLSHCVPPEVMTHDYGYDDLVPWEGGCLRVSDRELWVWVDVSTPSGQHHIPFAEFDNRHDLTTQIRVLPARLRHPDAMARLHAGLKGALDKLWHQYQRRIAQKPPCDAGFY